MDSLAPLVPFNPRCLLWGMLASVMEIQLGIHLMQSISMAYTMKPESQEELEVVGEQMWRKGWCLNNTRSYFACWQSNHGNLQVVSLTSQGRAVYLPSLECSIYHLACSMFILVAQCIVSDY